MRACGFSESDLDSLRRRDNFTGAASTGRAFTSGPERASFLGLPGGGQLRVAKVSGVDLRTARFERANFQAPPLQVGLPAGEPEAYTFVSGRASRQRTC